MVCLTSSELRFRIWGAPQSSPTFSRLKVIKRAEDAPVGRKGKIGAMWFCQCSCGNTTIVQQAKLRSGHTRSCGCMVKENKGRPKVTSRSKIGTL